MSAARKPGLIVNVFSLNCPRCRQAKLFKTGSFSFSQPFDMKDNCSYCNQDFQLEPGFYYGAMFIGYIFMAWFCLAFAGILHWVFGWSLTASFGLLIAFIAVFFVYIFRLARSIWISINVKYDPAAAQQESTKH